MSRRLAYQSQRPFTTPAVLNARPQDTILQRERVGSRSGLAKAISTQVGAGNPVRMLESVKRIHDGFIVWVDDFEASSLSANWAVDADANNIPPTIELQTSVTTAEARVAAVRIALENLDTSSAYSVRIFISPFEGSHQGFYRLYMGLNASTPGVDTDGFMAELWMAGTSGDFTGRLVEFTAGTATVYAFTNGSSGSPEAGWFEMVRASNDTVTCKWLHNALITSQGVTAGGSWGHRVGFGIEATESGGVCLVDTFEAAYSDTVGAETLRNEIVSASNGDIWREIRPGTMANLSATPQIATDVHIMAQDRGQKLYIADIGLKVDGTDGVKGTANDKLDAASNADWSDDSIDADDDIAIISTISVGGGGIAGVYGLDSVGPGELDLDADWTTGVGTAGFRIQRAWKIFDPIAVTLVIMRATAGKGQVPHQCRGIALYRDRLVGFQDPTAPHVWFMSRSGDPLDWDFSGDPTDAQRAVAGTDAVAGQVGEPINAFAPYRDRFAVIGCTESLYRMDGDPADGGRIVNLSTQVGIVGRRAWAEGPQGQLLFLSRDGIYELPVGAGSPQPISKGPLPQEFINIPGDAEPMLAYDHKDRALHIFMTRTTGQIYSWWMRWDDQGFWRDLLPDDMQPNSILRYVSLESAKNSGILLGGRDGYIRNFDPLSVRDETTSVTSWVMIGPIALGDGHRDGILRRMKAALSKLSGSVTWEIFVGETPERAYELAEASGTIPNEFTGTWSMGARSHGLQYAVDPRARGQSCILTLTGASNDRAWSMEYIDAVKQVLGDHRAL